MDLQRKSLSRQIADGIRQRIRNGELLPDQKLNERELLLDMDVSRTPLREAISILAGEKLVELSASRGAVVKSLTDAEIDAMVRVRGTLERLAGQLLVDSVTADAIDGFGALCDTMDAACRANEPARWWECNSRFHRGLIGAAGNLMLLEYWENIAVRMNVYNFFNFQGVTTTDRWAASAVEHRAIIGLLTRRDGDGLGAMLERHLMDSWRVARTLVRQRSTQASAFSDLFRMAKADGAVINETKG